jgi:secondary thiamine-phosphate synthase enzyme
MKGWKSLTITTDRRIQAVDITSILEAELEEGSEAVLLFVPHTTAAITVNEGADPSVLEDVMTRLKDLVPHSLPSYRHFEGNSDSHIKSVLVGPSLVLPVEDGRLALGRWQAVFFLEFDGPRKRKVLLKTL